MFPDSHVLTVHERFVDEGTNYGETVASTSMSAAATAAACVNNNVRKASLCLAIAVLWEFEDNSRDCPSWVP